MPSSFSRIENHVGWMQKIRDTELNLVQHHNILNQMLAMIPMDSSRQISDHVKREIYHLYHAGRYTQEQLAAHFGVSQSTHRIVTGEAPPQLAGVNPNSLTLKIPEFTDW
ncbi:hypothetical protein [Xenorhabdus bovienii]|uniref:hypothetical protein n=1 Tax=Xenorhabdus bovienii TaxID=40576 RepID=UPI003DA1F7FB